MFTIAPSHPNWATVEKRALTLFTPLDFSPLPPEQAISYLGTPDSLNTWSHPVSLSSSSGESTSIENFFSFTSGGMLVKAGGSTFYLDSNAARNPEYLTTLWNMIQKEKDVVFIALESHSTSMVLKESSPIAMKLLDLTPQMFLIETNSSPLPVLVGGSFPNPVIIEASRQLLNNSLIIGLNEPNYISRNTSEVLPSPSDSKAPPLEVVVRKPDNQVRAPLATNTTAPNFTSSDPTLSQFTLLSVLLEGTTARSNSNNDTNIIPPLLTMLISRPLGNLPRVSIGKVSDKTSDLPAAVAGGAIASLAENSDPGSDDGYESDSDDGYESDSDDGYESDDDAEVTLPAAATGGGLPVERRDPILENKQAIEDAMRAAIASTTQINWGLGIKSKQRKNSELSAILDEFTNATKPEELKGHLLAFIKIAEQHRVRPLFFDSPTKSMQAFDKVLKDKNLSAVVDKIIMPKSGKPSL